MKNLTEGITMELKIDENHKLFARLISKSPEWWKNLIADPEIYIEIRKNNYINVYCNGGSLMKLEGSDSFKAEIHVKYIPLRGKGDYLGFCFKENDISFQKIAPLSLNNFADESLSELKKRIKKYYPNKSEKGLQGRYIIHNNNKVSSNGFFIDSEFQFSLEGSTKGRIDLVWVDLIEKKIIFVELKTMGDERLYSEGKQNPESIDVQLKKYHNFAEKNAPILINYYDKIFRIKNKLGILPSFVTETSLADYELCSKPILLIGDCSQDWIDSNVTNDKNPNNLNQKIQDIAHSAIYQGKTTFNFNIPKKDQGNIFYFDC